MRRLTRKQQREIAAGRDEETDISEMPEVIERSGAEVGKL